MTLGRAGSLLAVVIGPLAWCIALGLLVGGDPMLAIEVGGGVLVLAWAALVVREIVASHRVARALAVDADAIDLFGVPCLVTPRLGADALVVGAFRPRIFVGSSLIGALSDEELEAVVYHEDHHRRARAPLRAAALGGWLRLLGRSEGVRTAVGDRLADLETLADTDAIRRGSSPRSLARALLKGDLSHEPVAFSYAADRRIARLLDHGPETPAAASAQLPYEWLPITALAAVLIACHIAL
ncbi:MAG: hypothetical protein AABZ33_05250 [Chloroflexota bacterium]